MLYNKISLGLIAINSGYCTVVETTRRRVLQYNYYDRIDINNEGVDRDSIVNLCFMKSIFGLKEIGLD